MTSYNYIIIGGGIAGGRAVQGIRQLDEEGSIALVTRESHPPYQRPPLSKSYLRGEAALDRVQLHEEVYYQKHKVKLFENLVVEKIDPNEHEIHLQDGTNLNYEKLLLATGGNAIRLDIPGSHLENVFTLRTIEDSDAIRKASGEGKTALVMGGSFIGSEVSASLAEMGTKVIQIFPEKRLLERIVPEEISAYLQDLFTRHGVRVLPEIVAESLEGKEYVQRAILSNEEDLAIDLVVMGVGIQLNTELAKQAGLELRDNDQALIVDSNLRTSDENIYAAGDIAAWPDAIFNRRVRVEHWDVARKQGRQAGRNMAGENKAYTSLPYFFSDLFDLSFEVWGNLDQWDQTLRRGKLAEDSFAIYYFNQGRLCAVLSVARPDEEREPMQAMVKAQYKYAKIAAQIEDEHTNLAELAGIETENSKTDEELSFAEDIAPLFREMDVEEMKNISGFDLSDYEDVKARANIIHERLSDESMPCDEPWSKKNVNKFKQWIESGKQP